MMQAADGRPPEATQSEATMKCPLLAGALLVGASLFPGDAMGPQEPAKEADRFTKTFGEDARDFASTGSNPFFVLEPGYTLVLEGQDEGKEARITITVTAETQKIDGVEARAVEEREEV